MKKRPSVNDYLVFFFGPNGLDAGIVKQIFYKLWIDVVKIMFPFKNCGKTKEFSLMYDLRCDT